MFKYHKNGTGWDVVSFDRTVGTLTRVTGGWECKMGRIVRFGKTRNEAVALANREVVLWNRSRGVRVIRRQRTDTWRGFGKVG